MGLTKAEAPLDVAAKARDVIQSTGHGAHMDEAAYGAYVRADAALAASEVSAILEIKNPKLATLFDAFAVELAESVRSSHIDDLERDRLNFIQDHRDAIREMVGIAGGSPEDIRLVQVRHIMPNLLKALGDEWKALGFSNAADAKKRFHAIGETVMGMDADAIKDVLEKNKYLIDSEGKRNTTATFFESGEFKRLHDPGSSHFDQTVETRRERVALILVSLAHLAWKVVEIHRIAAQFHAASDLRNEGERTTALAAIDADVSNNFQSMRGVFVNMFKKGSRTVAVGADTYVVALTLALVEAAKGLRGAEDLAREMQ